MPAEHLRQRLRPGRVVRRGVRPGLDGAGDEPPLLGELGGITAGLESRDGVASDGRQALLRRRLAAGKDAHGRNRASLEEHDTREAVERGLSRLPADQREVLVLRLLAERSYKEIAEITGRKIGTVGWLVSLGLKALANELAPLVGIGGGVQGSAAVQPVAGRVAQGERS